MMIWMVMKAEQFEDGRALGDENNNKTSNLNLRSFHSPFIKSSNSSVDKSLDSFAF